MKGYKELQNCCGWCEHSSNTVDKYGALFCRKHREYVDFSGICNKYSEWKAEFLKKFSTYRD